MAELKPCPFCGKSVYLEKVPLWRKNGTTTHGYFGCYEFVAKCRNIQCGCSVNLFQNDTVYRSEDKAKESAIKAWNRRADNVRSVKIGHYITDDMGDSSCSECGEKYLDITKRFCPKCGAELRRNDGDQ